MDITNTNLTPSYTIGNSVESSNNNQKKPGIQKTNDESSFDPKSVILDLSLDGIRRSKSESNTADQNTNLKKLSKNMEDARLNEAQLQVVQKLKVIDLHVKMHEQQHLAVAGAYACGGPTFQYQVGPDGNAYAVAGEVKLDMSSIPNNPQATIAKAQTIRQAALAPSDPSGADRAVAAAASQMESQAHMELIKNSSENVTANSANSKTNDNSDANSNTKNSQTSSHGNFFMKAYQNFLNKWQPAGNFFNKIA